MGKFINEQKIVGKKYGDLLVKEFMYRSGSPLRMYYKVICSYGKEFIIQKKVIIKWSNKQCNHCKSLECPRLNQKYIGKKWNSLTCISFDHIYKRDAYFKFKCECGNEKIIRLDKVISGEIKSCGCKRKIGIKTHGLSRSRIYKEHQQIIQRCYNQNVSNYNDYGGRGISVCEEWLQPAPYGFENFYNWAINNGYRDDLSIDRINVNGNYEPSNCRWVDNIVQSYNKRNTPKILYNGEFLSALDIHNKYLPNIEISKISAEIRSGANIDKILNNKIIKPVYFNNGGND